MRIFATTLSNKGEELLNLPWATFSKSLGYQNISEGILNSGALGNYQFSPNIYTIQDKTFIALFGNRDSGSRVYFIIYDAYRNRTTDLIDTGLFHADGDAHNAPAIFPTLDGRMVIKVTPRGVGVTRERLTTISDYDYDVRNMSAWSTVFWSTEYPHIQRFSDGFTYSIERRSSTSWLMQVLRSSNDGIHYGWLYNVYYANNPPNDDIRPYTIQMWVDDDVFRVFINRIENYRVRQQYLMYMESYDKGKTWQNIDNTYSQDVSITSIDESTIYNYTAYDAGTDGFIRANGATWIDGKPYAMGGIGTDWTMGVIYYDGSNWQAKKIVCSGYTIAPAYLNPDKLSDGSFIKKIGSYYHVFVQIIDGNNHTQLCEFKTIDLDTWTFVKQFTSGLFSHSLAKTNFGDNLGSIIVSTKSYGDVTSSGDIYINKI